MEAKKRPVVYLECASCGEPIKLGSRHKAVVSSERGRDAWGSVSWRPEKTAYLCDECYGRVLDALAERGK